MHDYLKKVVEVLGMMHGTVLSLSDFLRALFIGLIILALAFLAIDIVWLRNKREKKRKHTLLEKELYRVQETDDVRKGERKTVIDAFRLRFLLDNPPAKRNAVEDQMDTTDEEAERKYDERMRVKAKVDKRS